VLGESFRRPPQAAAPAPVPGPTAGDAPSVPNVDPTTTAAPAFTPETTTTSAPAGTIIATTPAQQSVPTTSTAPVLVPPSSTTTSTTSPRPAPARVAVDDVVSTPVKGPVHIDVLANDHEPGGTLNPKSVSIVVPPLHGKAKVDKDGRVHYNPAGGYSGPDAFTYSVCDTAGQCFTAQVTLSVVAH